MNTQRALLAMTLLITPSVAANASAQVDQVALAEQLLSGDIVEQSRALETVQTLGGQNASPAVREALIKALDREANRQARRYLATRRGELVEPDPNPEYVLQLSRIVADLRDPTAIGALANALGTGMTVVRALVEFGEIAAPPIVAVVASPASMHYAVDDGLIALRMMVEARGIRPISRGTLDLIRRVAEQRLTSPGHLASTGVTLRWAIDLAVVLKDDRLTAIVRSLASNPNEIIARGVEDPDLIELTRRRAAERLAGIPPQPRS
jgi:hypothetical protein